MTALAHTPAGAGRQAPRAPGTGDHERHAPATAHTGAPTQTTRRALRAPGTSDRGRHMPMTAGAQAPDLAPAPTAPRANAAGAGALEAACR
jgi:hypothetical protein